MVAAVPAPHAQELLAPRHSALRPSCVPARVLGRLPLPGEKGGEKGRGRGAGQGFPTGILRHRGAGVRRLRPERCPRRALSSTAGDTAKAEVAGRVPLSVSSWRRVPFQWAKETLGAFQQHRPPTTSPFPGSRSDKGVHLAQADPRKMKPSRLQDHPAVPEGRASELSPSPSPATFGVPGQL